jgi:hypothetical protein
MTRLLETQERQILLKGEKIYHRRINYDRRVNQENNLFRALNTSGTYDLIPQALRKRANMAIGILDWYMEDPMSLILKQQFFTTYSALGYTIPEPTPDSINLRLLEQAFAKRLDRFDGMVKREQEGLVPLSEYEYWLLELVQSGDAALLTQGQTLYQLLPSEFGNERARTSDEKLSRYIWSMKVLRKYGLIPDERLIIQRRTHRKQLLADIAGDNGRRNEIKIAKIASHIGYAPRTLKPELAQLKREGQLDTTSPVAAKTKRLIEQIDLAYKELSEQKKAAGDTTQVTKNDLVSHTQIPYGILKMLIFRHRHEFNFLPPKTKGVDDEGAKQILLDLIKTSGKTPLLSEAMAATGLKKDSVRRLLNELTGK